MQLSIKDLEDAADLCDKFASSCEVEYDRYSYDGRMWLRNKLDKMALELQKRADAQKERVKLKYPKCL